MVQYIDKSALVAEIERRKSQFMSQADNFHSLGMEEKRDHFAVLASNMHSILSFLDTLEVKEVQEEPVSNDLEEAASNFVKSYIKGGTKQSWLREGYIAGAKWQRKQIIQ